MKNTDSDKVKKALAEISKLKFQEDKDGGNDFKKGIARSVVSIILDDKETAASLKEILEKS